MPLSNMTTKPLPKIVDLVPVSLLENLQESYLNYLHTSATIYEIDGSRAASMITSQYCKCLAEACEARAGKGKGICCEDRWRVSKKSIDLKAPYADECSGGLIIYSVPIMFGGEPIGAAVAAVSNPPRDAETIKKVAKKFKLSVEDVQTALAEHQDRPKFALDAAKSQVEIIAKTIAALYEAFYKLHMKEERLAKEITKRERVEAELGTLNEFLEQHVAKRAAELVKTTEELREEIATQKWVKTTEQKRAEEKLKQSMDKLRKALGGTLQALVLMVETRDPYTVGHPRRVADLARAIATEMGLSEEQIDGIRMAGAIHDIGKIAIPANIFNKPAWDWQGGSRISRLTKTEFDVIKTHPKVGYEILKEIEFPWPVAQIVFQYHERLDGSGYPSGLSGDEIILESRILGVADVVEAMASPRSYRPALGIDKALEEISRNRGVLYDADAVDACLRLFTERRFEFK
ncbi:MAG: HD domain-containing phosphohydrolase [Candidatus Brocadiales bacterium]